MATPIPPEPLTQREREIAALITMGLGNSEISRRLSVSRATVATHVSKILKKLGLRSRVQIAVWMTERQLNDRR